MNERTIFENALDLHDPAARAAYVAAACGRDAQLQARVAALLDSHELANSFLRGAAVATIDLENAPEYVGTNIGPYKIREQIGEGGMGVVYVAEQTEPVRRKVALKIIRPGMATRDVIARFEAERQALAMMDHPHIARVLDAGTTGEGFRCQVSGVSEHQAALSPTPDTRHPTPHTGQPYFVMELVQGVPITEYCDRERLTPVQRLQLFQKVCRAVHHAHQKGIIHRDLKPTNVLVPEIDGEAVPKVIDFGVAKALGPKLTEHTVYTQFTQLVGTPLYMSPEQAGLGVIDIDTRSDVYSLGVLLYELLTGQTPFDSQALKQAGFDEMRRIIREEEPLRPSDRLRSLSLCTNSLSLWERAGVRANNSPVGEQNGNNSGERVVVKETAADLATTIADRRGTDCRRLVQTMRGELDWIVMKCLEKDRNRRYESASALAADVQLYLDGEPIQARPPRWFAGARRWCRRHRTATTAGAVAAILLLMFASGMAADRQRQLRETRFSVETSLKATRNALEANDLNQAVTRIAEAQARLAAGRLHQGSLVDDVAVMQREVDRYGKFQLLVDRARDHMTGAESGIVAADEALALYNVVDKPKWLEELKTLCQPEGHVQRIVDAVYELLLLKADHLTRWSAEWPKAVRKARLEAQSREAIECLERAVAIRAPSRGYYWLLANCWLHLGDRDKEKQFRATALETPPKSAAELFYINRDHWWGTVSEYAGYPAYTFEECYRDYREMLRLEPSYYIAMYFAALRLEEERRYAEALVGWYACSAINPNEAAADFHRAVAHTRLGQFDEARAAIEAVLARKSDDALKLAEVAFFLATDASDAMRDGPRSVAIAEKGCKLTNYGDARLLDALACGYAECGNFESAVKWSEMAVKLCDTWRTERYTRHLESFRQGKPWRQEVPPK